MSAVLVTGAASGIGRATALRAAATGAGVALGTFARDPYDAGEVVAEIEAAGGSAFTVDADVRSTPGMTQAVEATGARFGGLDGVVANAGILQAGAAGRAHRRGLVPHRRRRPHRRDADRAGSRARPPRGRSGGGHLEHRGGGRGLAGSHALRRQQGRAPRRRPQRRALELAPRGIRINAVLPGVIESPQSLDPVNSGGPAGLAASASTILLDHVGQPADVADVIGFLFSPAARYVTGQHLAIDGGLTVAWPT